MRILSGIQPSGETHLGNFFGAMRQHVALQTEGEAIYFVADYHSMTSLRDAAERRRLVREVALDYLACGLDPQRAILYRQSDLPETCELAWILTTVTPMGLLQRAHSYKDKIAQGLKPEPAGGRFSCVSRAASGPSARSTRSSVTTTGKLMVTMREGRTPCCCNCASAASAAARVS